MRRIRLRADSALHVAGTQLAVVSDDVGVHAMDSVTLSHAHHLVASALAEWADTPAPVADASLPEVMAIPDEPTAAEYGDLLAPPPALAVRSTGR